MIRCPRCSILYASLAACPACGFAPARIEGLVAWAPHAARQGEFFEPSFFAELAACEEGNFWFEARNALIVAMLRRHAPNLSSYLEVGCGTGFVVKGVRDEFPNARLIGSELFIEGLSFAARRNPDAEFVQMDAQSIPYVDEFDVAAAFDVLEHIADDERVIANVFTAVRPGGLFIATVPQHPCLWSASDEIGRHVRRYKRAELQCKVQAAGFSIVRSTSFVSLLLPLMALSRRRMKTGKPNDAMAEFRIPVWLNSALAAALTVERTAILAGANFPIGGSRLVVARRPAPADR